MSRVEIGSGYRPGLLGWCVAEQATYHGRELGFGRFFETRVAAEMADFLDRLDAPGNHVFWAAEEDRLLASITLDGGAADAGRARLRWFIAAEAARGRGLGHRLLERTIAAARADCATGIYLTTVAGLDAARRLYERASFRLVHESEDRTWGKPILEQRFELDF